MFSFIVNYYNSVMSKRDIRLDNHFFIEDPLQPIISAVLYFWLVTKIIPKYMEDRKPFQLRNVLLFYNAFQVILSAYIFKETIASGVLFQPWYKCIPVDYSNNPEALRVVHISYIYYLSKYGELLDTVLFVLRKKNNQVTFLHLYHHGGMPIFTFAAVKFAPGGSISSIGLINSLVHIAMYGYYFLSALGPKVQKYIFWKRYITTLQITQFLILLVHFIIVLLTPSCNIPRPIAYIFTLNIIINYVLFYSFYKKEYKNKNFVQSSATKDQFTKVNGKKL